MNLKTDSKDTAEILSVEFKSVFTLDKENGRAKYFTIDNATKRI